jgi:uncharacterized protein YhfF
MGNAYPIWDRYLQSIGEDPDTTLKKYIFVDHFCHTREAADRLYELAVAGIKRATTGSLWGYEHRQEPVLKPGDLTLLTNYDESKMCVIRP